MKNLSVLVVGGLMIANLASAVVNPRFERPIMGAQLTYIEPTKPVLGLKANYLTLNQRDDSKEPSSFTLREDTGIRCFRAPCPSMKDTQFKITAMLPAIHSGSVRYEAVEVLKNIPPHVRIARRHLNVTESSMELVAPGGVGFMERTVWEVEVVRFAAESQSYYGNPEALASIALD